MTRFVRAAAMLAMLMLGTAACGSSSLDGGGGPDGGSGPGGVDRSKQVTAVTAADKEKMCDWFVAMVGGYGAAPTCAMAFISAPPDKPDCIATFPVCAVTVGSLQDCMETILAAQAVCTTDALAAAQANANCQTVGAAGCFD
jgi:hypothetical protein